MNAKFRNLRRNCGMNWEEVVSHLINETVERAAKLSLQNPSKCAKITVFRSE